MKVVQHTCIKIFTIYTLVIDDIYIIFKLTRDSANNLH